jgi:uncharacterized protein
LHFKSNLYFCLQMKSNINDLKMKKEFKVAYGEWALVTGASSGIGKALVFEIAKKGLNVVLVSRRQNELDQIALEIQNKYKVSVMVIPADLSTEVGLIKVKNETEGLNIGLLVLSAGMESNGLFTKSSLEKEMQLIQLNVLSTMVLTHHFAKKMEAQKKGGILLVSSLTAHMPSPYFSNYAGTKSYVLNFGISLYGELKSKGIDVSVLSPGVTNTPMSENTGIDWSKTPVKTMSPEDVAYEAIHYFEKKLSIVPGKGNRIMAFLSKHILSYTKLAVANQKMMSKVLNPSKL